MNDKKPTPIEAARQLIQDERRERAESFNDDLASLKELYRCNLVAMPGQATMDANRNIIIPAGTVEIVVLD